MLLKLSRRLHTWWCPSVDSFKFRFCNHTSPATAYWFPISTHQVYGRLWRVVSWYSSWFELRGYLIDLRLMRQSACWRCEYRDPKRYESTLFDGLFRLCSQSLEEPIKQLQWLVPTEARLEDPTKDAADDVDTSKEPKKNCIWSLVSNNSCLVVAVKRNYGLESVHLFQEFLYKSISKWIFGPVLAPR